MSPVVELDDGAGVLHETVLGASFSLSNYKVPRWKVTREKSGERLAVWVDNTGLVGPVV